MTNITLTVIPCSGARQLSLNSNITVAQLVHQENLYGRDIIINGSPVHFNEWENTVVPPNSEVSAINIQLNRRNQTNK